MDLYYKMVLWSYNQIFYTECTIIYYTMQCRVYAYLMNDYLY